MAQIRSSSRRSTTTSPRSWGLPGMQHGSVLDQLRYNGDLRRKLCAALLILVALISVYLRHDFCYGSTRKLQELYHGTIVSFEKVGEPYWVDYGTLLGATREKALIEHEYDLDFGILESDCEKIYAKKDIFAENGIILVGRRDFIASKHTLKWDTAKKEFYISDGYIHAPCLRAYHKTNGYFADIYSYEEYTPADFRKRVEAKKDIFLPTVDADGTPFNGNTTTSTVVCNKHGLDAEEYEPGGCQVKSFLFPLQRINFLGRMTNSPAKPEQFVRELYGDDWRTPRTKGIRGPLCHYQW